MKSKRYLSLYGFCWVPALGEGTSAIGVIEVEGSLEGATVEVASMSS